MSKCPICGKPMVAEFAPFCSKHCQNIDLLKWLKEDYRVPTQDVDEEESVPSPSEDNDED
ncbi:DNA gyrase inhibitor YacG [Candidatus Paracaedibacter symbiosus]|uniref:DNA gyrase inhibitor YacG n=1 Tax=Candidatus Paracaedibacter symbiosus TaxID=244582 RepID=UPI00050993B5|nr:DNA gyrase inhibitor YacG [Candidatus Paracaedibacter symbiosus]